MLYPKTVIAGCGNPLFADDGFGPAVAEELQKTPLPPGVKVVDAGICGTYYIFSLVDAERTRRLIIIDSVDFGSEPGSIGFFGVDDLPAGSYCDPSRGTSRHPSIGSRMALTYSSSVASPRECHTR